MSLPSGVVLSSKPAISKLCTLCPLDMVLYVLDKLAEFAEHKGQQRPLFLVLGADSFSNVASERVQVVVDKVRHLRVEVTVISCQKCATLCGQCVTLLF